MSTYDDYFGILATYNEYEIEDETDTQWDEYDY